MLIFNYNSEDITCENDDYSLLFKSNQYYSFNPFDLTQPLFKEILKLLNDGFLFLFDEDYTQEEFEEVLRESIEKSNNIKVSESVFKNIKINAKDINF